MHADTSHHLANCICNETRKNKKNAWILMNINAQVFFPILVCLIRKNQLSVLLMVHWYDLINSKLYIPPRETKVECTVWQRSKGYKWNYNVELIRLSDCDRTSKTVQGTTYAWTWRKLLFDYMDQGNHEYSLAWMSQVATTARVFHSQNSHLRTEGLIYSCTIQTNSLPEYNF